MSTHRIPIIGSGSTPDDSGNMFFEPYAVKATNDVWRRLVAIFNEDAAAVLMYGGFTVPKNYIDNAKIVIYWTSIANSGDVEWDFAYRAVAAGQDLDDTAQEGVNQEDTAPANAHDLVITELALTSGNFAVDDEVEFILSRDGSDAGDTMAAAAIVFAVMFEYTDI